MKLLLATRNAHKLREFERLLGGVELVPLPDGADSPEETGDTYAENALIKARAAAAWLAAAKGEEGAAGDRAAAGGDTAAGAVAAIADDSGIEAEALGWLPGVRTARFAGEGATDGENLDKLHREAPAGSRARYVCVIAHVTPDGEERLFEGRCAGTLAAAPAGSGGFGYDPIFVADEAPGRTMAELADAEKDAISHRGHAARALLEWLRTG